MKSILLILSSMVAAFVPAVRSNLCTANGAAEDILERLGLTTDASPDEIEAARRKLIDAANPAAIPAGDVLGLGGLALPTGLDKKDVLWRKRAGLSTKHAVQAALAQKRHDEMVGKDKAAKGKNPAVPSAALAGATPKFTDMTVAQLTAYATEKKIELGGAKTKPDITAAIEAFNKALTKEERAAS